MHAFALTLVALSLSTSALAGPGANAFAYHNHGNSIRHVRRHHSRQVQAQPLIQREATAGDCDDSDDSATTTTCTSGEWKCDGSQLQRCSNDNWNVVQNCTGDNVVCSADPGMTGCVWAWSVSGESATTASATASVTAAPSLSTIGGVLTSNSNGTDTEDCDDEWETVECDAAGNNCQTVTETSTVPTATSTGKGSHVTTAPMSTTTGSGDNGDCGDDWEEVECDDDGTNCSVVSSGPTSTAKGHHNATATATATGSALPTLPSSGGNNTSGSPGNWQAPHYVIYADNWLDSMPSASQMTGYNRFILAFWMTNTGAVDNVQAWTQWSDSYRQQVLDEYHAAGIALMISAFGSTDSPTSNGADPVQTAQDLASFVKQYSLDGVDIDYEDMPAMNSNQAEDWINKFQAELRNQLPSGQYIISHAPVAPWFTTANVYQSGAYLAINAQVGDGIDFYNVQFYNQGNIYMDCTTLMTNSGGDWPGTSVMEINSAGGVPLHKIVLGKPMDSGAADNGYMDPSSLAKCVAEGVSQGWAGSVMFWEWDGESSNQVMLSIRG